MSTTQIEAGQAKPAIPPKSKFKKFLVITVIVLIVIWFIYYFICGMAYSEGTRSGVLTKVSKKGYIFKTYEGDMNLGGIAQGDGTLMPNNIFKFSVTQDSIYNKLESLQGKKVVLTYKQVIHNFFWQGETDYFIYDAKVVQ